MTDTLTETNAAVSEQAEVAFITRVVRGVGWTLIWLGLLTVGFVVHQIYVTTWLAQQEQAELEAERLEYFDEVTDAIQPVIVDETGTPVTDVGTGEPVDPTVTPAPGQGPSGGDGTEIDPAAGDGGDDPAGAVRSEPLVIIPEPEVPQGKAFAVIRIPTIDRLKDGWNIVEGVELRQLRKGAGHMPGTPYPGQRGNSVISGHRTTYGAPFHELDDLDPGDQIEVETAVGVHVYEVRESIIVKPSALWVTHPRDGAWLTLTTCHPKFSARQRLVVFAELVDGPNFETIERLTG